MRKRRIGQGLRPIIEIKTEKAAEVKSWGHGRDPGSSLLNRKREPMPTGPGDPLLNVWLIPETTPTNVESRVLETYYDPATGDQMERRELRLELPYDQAFETWYHETVSTVDGRTSRSARVRFCGNDHYIGSFEVVRERIPMFTLGGPDRMVEGRSWMVLCLLPSFR